jgi:hypothetical protein
MKEIYIIISLMEKENITLPLGKLGKELLLMDN